MSLKQGRTRWWVAFLSVATCLALLALIHLYRPPAAGLWLETFYNSVHVPVFALIAIGVFAILRSLSRLSVSQCILVAGGIAVLLGLLSEVAQIAGPRDASFEDLLSDWLGAISGLLLVMALHRGKDDNSRRRVSLGIAGLVLMSVALSPLILVSAAYVERNNALPSLFKVDSKFGNRFLRLQNSALEKTNNPTDQRIVGKVALGDGAWPGLVFHDIWPDWTDYSLLLIELKLDESEPLEIHVRVHDYKHTRGRQRYSDRFNMTYVLKPGIETIRIPLEEIQNAPADRLMDMAMIDTLAIFATRAESGRSFSLVEIRLDR